MNIKASLKQEADVRRTISLKFSTALLVHYTAISKVDLASTVVRVFTGTANKIYAINKNLLQHQAVFKKK
jgi:hypothetical protein